VDPAERRLVGHRAKGAGRLADAGDGWQLAAIPKSITFAQDNQNGTRTTLVLCKEKALVYPVLASAGLANGIVMAIAVNALAVAGGNDPPKISVSTTGALHMEDTNPLPLASVGTPNTVAAPMRSLFQTATIAMRLIANLTWAMRAPGGVAWVQNVTW